MLKKAELNILPQSFSLFLFQEVRYVINPRMNQLVQEKCIQTSERTRIFVVALYCYFNLS